MFITSSSTRRTVLQRAKLCAAESQAQFCYTATPPRPPAGQYCVTHEPVLEREGKAHKNLKVWSCDDGELVAEFHRRGITDDHWPVIQFDAAETHVFFTVNNAIVYYSMDGDMTKADGKVKLEGVSQFKIGPAKRKLVATFVPESSKPAVFAVLDWEDGSTVNRKNFYRVRPPPFDFAPRRRLLLCAQRHTAATRVRRARCGTALFGRVARMPAADRRCSMRLPEDKACGATAHRQVPARHLPTATLSQCVTSGRLSDRSACAVRCTF